MLALVTSAVLPALFIASGLFALTVLIGTWRAYAGAFDRLRGEIATCEMSQTITVSRTVHGAQQAGVFSAAARRTPSPFNRPVTRAVLRPAQPALRAAA